MKIKSFTIIIILILSITLCSCNIRTDYHELNNRVLVSAIGIDSFAGKINLTVETIDVVDNSSSDEYSSKLYKSTGTTLEHSFLNITNSISKELLLSHCALIAIGDSINSQEMSKIFNYCFEKSDITMSVNLVSAESAGELLSCNKEGSLVVGYSLVELLKSNKNSIGISKHSDFIDILNCRNNYINTYSLPYFGVTQKNKNPEFELLGLKVYKNDEYCCFKNQLNSQIFKIIKNEFSCGKLIIDEANESIIIDITDCNVSMDEEFKNNRLVINLNIDIKTDKNQYSKINNFDIKGILKKLITLQISESQKSGQSDIFNFIDKIKNSSKINKTVKSEYERYFENALINIKCENEVS